jgi:hypothetical protein
VLVFVCVFVCVCLLCDVSLDVSCCLILGFPSKFFVCGIKDMGGGGGFSSFSF